MRLKWIIYDSCFCKLKPLKGKPSFNVIGNILQYLVTAWVASKCNVKEMDEAKEFVECSRLVAICIICLPS